MNFHIQKTMSLPVALEGIIPDDMINAMKSAGLDEVVIDYRVENYFGGRPGIFSNSPDKSKEAVGADWDLRISLDYGAFVVTSIFMKIAENTHKAFTRDIVRSFCCMSILIMEQINDLADDFCDDNDVIEAYKELCGPDEG